MDSQRAHILIVEDDLALANWMLEYLRPKFDRVEHVASGQDAINAIEHSPPDVVILDGMLPDIDGFDVCRAVRPVFQNSIIMVTARDEEIDEVLGLEMGADEYLTKPVRARALLTRIRKHLERQQKSSEDKAQNNSKLLQNTTLHFNNLVIDRQKLEVIYKDEIIHISTTEFELLWILADQAGEIVSRTELITQLRGFDYDGFDRSIDLKISRIRKKLGDTSNPATRIKTVWGKGYLFLADAWE